MLVGDQIRNARADLLGTGWCRLGKEHERAFFTRVDLIFYIKHCLFVPSNSLSPLGAANNGLPDLLFWLSSSDIVTV
jgi:hypothetical protein